MNGWGRMSLPLRDLMRCPNPTIFLDLRLLVVLMAFIPLCSSSTNHPISNLTLYPYYDQFYNQRPRGIPQQNFIAGSIQLDASKDIDPILMGKVPGAASKGTSDGRKQTQWWLFTTDQLYSNSSLSLVLNVFAFNPVCVVFVDQSTVNEEELKHCILAENRTLSENNIWFLDLNVFTDARSLHQSKSWYLERIHIRPVLVHPQFTFANMYSFGSFFTENSPAIAFFPPAISDLDITFVGTDFPVEVSLAHLPRLTSLSIQQVDPSTSNRFLGAPFMAEDFFVLMNGSVYLEYPSETVRSLKINLPRVQVFLRPRGADGKSSSVLFARPAEVELSFINLGSSLLERWGLIRKQSHCADRQCSEPYRSVLSSAMYLKSWSMNFSSRTDYMLVNEKLPKNFFDFVMLNNVETKLAFSVGLSTEYVGNDPMPPWRCGFPSVKRFNGSLCEVSFSNMLVDDEMAHDLLDSFVINGSQSCSECSSQKVLLSSTIWNVSTSFSRDAIDPDTPLAAVNWEMSLARSQQQFGPVNLSILPSPVLHSLHVRCVPPLTAHKARALVILPEMSFASNIYLESCSFEVNSSVAFNEFFSFSRLKTLHLVYAGLNFVIPHLLPCRDRHISEDCCSSLPSGSIEQFSLVGYSDIFPSVVTKSVLCQFTDLKMLNLSYNGIEKIEPLSLENVLATESQNVLDLTNNRLRNIPLLLKDISSTTIFAAHNRLVDISNVFCSQLMKGVVDLSYNELKSFDLEREVNKCNVSREIPMLYKIDLSYNHIETVLLKNWSTFYPSCSFFSSYHEGLINLSHNSLSSFDIGIQIDSATFTRDSYGDFKCAQEHFEPLPLVIDLSLNYIATLPSHALSSLPNLRVLNMKHNKVSLIHRPFISHSCGIFGCEINLADNQLGSGGEDWRVDNLFVNTSIRRLDLGNNQFKTVPLGVPEFPFVMPERAPEGTFPDAFYTSIILRDNYFRHITSSICPLHVDAKVYVDLSDAGVEYVGPDVFKCESLKNRLMVNLNRNPKLRCLSRTPSNGLNQGQNTLFLLSLVDTNVVDLPNENPNRNYSGVLNSLALGNSSSPYISCCDLLPFADGRVKYSINPDTIRDWSTTNLYYLVLGVLSAPLLSNARCFYVDGRYESVNITELVFFQSVKDYKKRFCSDKWYMREPKKDAYQWRCLPPGLQEVKTSSSEWITFGLVTVVLVAFYLITCLASMLYYLLFYTCNSNCDSSVLALRNRAPPTDSKRTETPAYVYRGTPYATYPTAYEAAGKTPEYSEHFTFENTTSSKNHVLISYADSYVYPDSQSYGIHVTSVRSLRCSHSSSTDP